MASDEDKLERLMEVYNVEKYKGEPVYDLLVNALEQYVRKSKEEVEEEEEEIGLALPYDVTFNEMVKADAKTLQNMCNLNKEYREFCSRNNEQFWKAKYKHDVEPLEGLFSWKDLWISMYKRIRSDENAGKYIY